MPTAESQAADISMIHCPTNSSKTIRMRRLINIRPRRTTLRRYRILRHINRHTAHFTQIIDYSHISGRRGAEGMTAPFDDELELVLYGEEDGFRDVFRGGREDDDTLVWLESR